CTRAATEPALKKPMVGSFPGSAPARRERPRRRPAAECGQQFPPSDGDCHTPLPCEVRKGNEPRHERAVLPFKDGRTLVASTSVSAASLCLYPPGRIRSIYREPIALEANRNVSPIAATRQPSPA